MKRRANRRDFLKQTSVAGVGFWVAGGVTLGDSKSPNDKLNFACIGVGGKGDSDTSHVGALGNIVALCDIDDNTLERKSRQFPQAKKYNDFRKMFDEIGKTIDAVTVSTPDHTHAVASIMAMKMGKHVYCQKPLTYSVSESRTMRDTAAKYKLATQMGNQGTATDGFRQGVEVIRSGIIGPIREVHVWTNRPVWPQAPVITARPKESPPPSYVHWNEWLGPAPERPYSGEKQNNGHPPYHDFNWRGWWDFGTGALGDMGCHTANLPFMALKLAYPSSIVAEAGDLNPETYPAWATVTYQFPARDEMPPVKFVWYEGKRDGKKNLPPMDLFKGQQPSGSASLLVGDKGILYSPDDYGERHMLLPASDFAGHKAPDPTLPRHGKGDHDLNQKKEWVAAIRGGAPALSNFNYASLLAETILLGNVAIRAGKKLVWNDSNLKFVNAPEANQFLHREYRKGWTL
jgi:predicted dehydrogenase